MAKQSKRKPTLSQNLVGVATVGMPPPVRSSSGKPIGRATAVDRVACLGDQRGGFHSMEWLKRSRRHAAWNGYGRPYRNNETGWLPAGRPGCPGIGQQPVPQGPSLPLATTPLPFGSPAQPVPASLAQAQAAYAQALALEQAKHPASIDYYYAAISASWLALTTSSTAAPAASLDPQAWAIYHDSLARLILEGQRHGRLDPRRGLTINTASGQLVIPTRYFGFSWKPEDFHQLLVVGDYRTKRPRHVYRRPGLGVPLVVMRYQNGGGGFLGEQHPFAATAVLRPDVRAANATDSPSASVPGDAGPSLDFCDSLTIRQVPLAGMQLDLAADISAPFALATSQADQIKLRDLLLPGSSTNPAQLLFVEPYRPGKIPVVFIHGLLSEPSTWADPVNDLRAVPQVTERFQFWDFRYPTATSFLDSAAALREQLQQAVATVDPLGTDPALRQMVLVGHSMGGLLSKLQVTSSGSAIWSRVANRPLETIVADEGTKARLRRDCILRAVTLGATRGFCRHTPWRLVHRLQLHWPADFVVHRAVARVGQNSPAADPEQSEHVFTRRHGRFSQQCRPARAHQSFVGSDAADAGQSAGANALDHRSRLSHAHRR